ncbi:Antitoxin Phd_YefM, type II toxin-antitoxin system [Roseovarius litoreus]|jgi:antitoxin (DNA-binding transcriptional repressor) of toxin-antitoxin stability system|uniref:Antitoxin n=1 Tax=Roseovarius litoreus TaxID=1155722 RepID=A0A1M6ZQS7_9RHOB|nr:type II toxin-antitoxin system Phd/YefM family antitoxin [Roseovarius litoreus]SHL32683.1 Antitoxin Phd_YefM, type II toxin-antitoxin system [Roseovarius litoreus]
MVIEVSSDRLRSQLSAHVDHLLATGERLILTRHGRSVAALVRMKDLEALESVDQNREIFLEQRHAERMREFRMLRDGLL